MDSAVVDRRASKARAAASERRVAQRYKSLAICWADPGGMSAPIACRIIDISHSGAKLSQHVHAPLPDEFFLHTGHVQHYARVVWRKKNEVGVEFEVLTRPYV